MNKSRPSVMSEVKMAFDRLFGIHPFLHGNHTWVNIISLVMLFTCFAMYADQMGNTHELIYGTVTFLLVAIDIGSNLWGVRNQWQELTRFERIIEESFRIVFVLIIPSLTMNQFLKSDLSFYLLFVVAIVPCWYILPFMRTYFGSQNLYVNGLKISVFLNLLVSIRTTFFGICCSISILFAWSLRHRNMKFALLMTRAVASYLLYLTLCNVAIPRCVQPPHLRKTVDPCDTPEEACNYFRSYYSFS